MSTKKAGGSTSNGRDSISKRLGVKIYGNQRAETGNIIIRQRGTKFHPGKNVKRTNDDTLMALTDGLVQFKHKKATDFTGKSVNRIYVSVEPVVAAN
jgi:large subunit ribosomal protein L27